MFDKNIINEVRYGNPTFIQHKALREVHYLDALIESLQENYPYKNYSKEQIAELNSLAANLKELQSSDDKGKEISDTINTNIYTDSFISQTFFANSIILDKDIYTALHEDCYSISLKLKYFFNRPRPYQLAYYYKLSLFPDTYVTIDTPSYPSFNYLFSLMLKYVFSDNRNKNIFNYICEKIKNSRISEAINYPSDMVFSEKVFESVSNNNGFNKKYGIIR